MYCSLGNILSLRKSMVLYLLNSKRSIGGTLVDLPIFLDN